MQGFIVVKHIYVLVCYVSAKQKCGWVGPSCKTAHISWFRITWNGKVCLTIEKLIRLKTFASSSSFHSKRGQRKPWEMDKLILDSFNKINVCWRASKLGNVKTVLITTQKLVFRQGPCTKENLVFVLCFTKDHG